MSRRDKIWALVLLALCAIGFVGIVLAWIVSAHAEPLEPVSFSVDTTINELDFGDYVRCDTTLDTTYSFAMPEKSDPCMLGSSSDQVAIYEGKKYIVMCVKYRPGEVVVDTITIDGKRYEVRKVE